MERFNSPVTILSRTDFGEADRIITFLTPERGKIKAIAKGVRKSRSKLAGALEIFSVSQVMFLPGKNDIGTVMSAKLDRHYGQIVKDIDRTAAAYGFMKLVDKITSDNPEPAYFHLLNDGLAGLDAKLDTDLTQLWFKAHLLKLTGHMPNLQQDNSGQKLAAANSYEFDFDKMRFSPSSSGKYAVNDIKFLRVLFAAASPKVASRVAGGGDLTSKISQLVDPMLQAHLGIS